MVMNKNGVVEQCLILGLHPRDETAMWVYKKIEDGPTSFA